MRLSSPSPSSLRRLAWSTHTYTYASVEYTVVLKRRRRSISRCPNRALRQDGRKKKTHPDGDGEGRRKMGTQMKTDRGSSLTFAHKGKTLLGG